MKVTVEYLPQEAIITPDDVIGFLNTDIPSDTDRIKLEQDRDGCNNS